MISTDRTVDNGTHLTLDKAWESPVLDFCMAVEHKLLDELSRSICKNIVKDLKPIQSAISEFETHVSTHCNAKRLQSVLQDFSHKCFCIIY